MQSMKYLGIYIDNKLSWDVQCDKLCSNIAGRISVLGRIRQFCRTSTLNLATKKQSSLFLFLLCLFCLVSYKTRQRAQNHAARIVTGNFDYINFRSADLLYELNWASAKERFILHQ